MRPFFFPSAAIFDSMIRTQIRIEWADLDLYGHINNIAFFQYMQVARIAMCRHAGLTATIEPGKLSFILAASKCQYLSRLHFPGNVHIETRTSAIGNTSFTLQHHLFDDEGKKVAEGEDVLVLFDYVEDSKVFVGEELRARLLQDA